MELNSGLTGSFGFSPASANAEGSGVPRGDCLASLGSRLA